MSFPSEKFISNFIRHQFPSFYESEGENFILFMEAYYEWLEQDGNAVGEARRLYEYRDIDTTPATSIEDFLLYFQQKYLYGIPYAIISNKRFLLKHIQDIYRSKGTVRCFRLLFKLIYNQDIEIYLPKYDMLKVSDGTWTEPKYLEVTDSPVIDQLRGIQVIGSISNTIATVEKYIREPIKNNIVSNLYISNIIPEGAVFEVGEKLLNYANQQAFSLYDAPEIIGSLDTLKIISGGDGFNPGDILAVAERDETTGKSISYGAAGLLKVTKTSKSQGTLEFFIEESGFGYTQNTSIYFYKAVGDNAGYGAGFEIGPLSYTRNLSYNTDLFLNYQNVVFDSQQYGFPDNPVANSEYEIQSAISFSNNTFGSIFNLTNVSPGNNYSESPEIIVRSSMLSLECNTTTFEITANTTYGFLNSADVIKVAQANQYFTNNAVVRYVVPEGGHPIEPLVSNTLYYVAWTNSSSVALKSTLGGANVNITYGNTTPDGEKHKLILSTQIQYKNATPFVSTLGSINYTTTTDVMTGIDTFFTEIFSNDDVIALRSSNTVPIEEYHRIKEVQSDTVMVLYENPSTNSTISARYYKTPNIKGIGTRFTELFVNNDVISIQANTDTDTREYCAIKLVANDSTIILYDAPKYNSTIDASFFIAPNILTSQYALYEPVMYTPDGTIPGYNSIIGALPNNGNNIVSEVIAYNSGKGYLEGEKIKAYSYNVLTVPAIFEGGTGYANDETLTFAGGTLSQPANGFITTNTSGGIVGVTLVDPGSGYFSVPQVLINTENGSGAKLVTSIAPPNVFNTYSVVVGTVVKSGVGRAPGYWSTNRGFLNSDKYIQDSLFYQDYSYQIRVANTLDKYKNILYDTFHSSGMELFGEYLDFEVKSSKSAILIESKKPSFGLLTVDTTRLTVDNIDTTSDATE